MVGAGKVLLDSYLLFRGEASTLLCPVLVYSAFYRGRPISPLETHIVLLINRAQGQQLFFKVSTRPQKHLVNPQTNG